MRIWHWRKASVLFAVVVAEIEPIKTDPGGASPPLAAVSQSSTIRIHRYGNSTEYPRNAVVAECDDARRAIRKSSLVQFSIALTSLRDSVAIVDDELAVITSWKKIGMAEADDVVSMTRAHILGGILLTAGASAVFFVIAMVGRDLAARKRYFSAAGFVSSAEELSATSDVLVGSNDWVDFNWAVEQEFEDCHDYLRLTFNDLRIEDEFLSFNIQKICSRSMFLTCYITVYSLWEMLFMPQRMFEWAPTLNDWDTAPGILFNISWLGVFYASLTMTVLLALPAFRQFRNAEVVIVAWACLITFLTMTFGNRWRVSRLFGLPGPTDPPFKAFTYDDRLILTLTMLLLYFAMFTPMRFSRFMVFGFVVGLVYPLSNLAFSSPSRDPNQAEGHVGFGNICVLLGLVCLVFMGQRLIERQRRCAFYILVTTFQRQQSNVGKLSLY